MRPDEVIGHTQQRLAFEKLISKDALAQTLLLAGPAGIGKSCVARELARKLICKGQLEREQVFDAGNCPDFYLQNCSVKDESSTSDIRELLGSLSYQSFAGGARVVVLNDVESLSTQALNALLKNLEEPRTDLFFILISSKAARILPTIISRCQVWQFSELNASQVATVLENRPDILGSNLDRGKLPLLTDLAAGSLENIGFLYENLERLQDLESHLKQLASGDCLLALEMAQQLAKDKELLSQEISLLSRITRRIMRASINNHTVQNYTVQNYTVQNYTVQWDALLADLLQLDWLIFERNINPTIALQHIFLSFARYARSPNFANSYPSILAQIV